MTKFPNISDLIPTIYTGKPEIGKPSVGPLNPSIFMGLLLARPAATLESKPANDGAHAK